MRSPGSAARARTATSAICSIRAACAAASYGYTGIVVAALARYNPFAVVLVALLLGGLQNAGFTLQGADFPAGLVGMMQGLILFCALGGELLVRYRVRFGARRLGGGGGRRVNNSLVVVVAGLGRRSTARRCSSPRSASCSQSARACSTSASRG